MSENNSNRRRKKSSVNWKRFYADMRAVRGSLQGLRALGWIIRERKLADGREVSDVRGQKDYFNGTN